jgi:hypothetical protein
VNLPSKMVVCDTFLAAFPHSHVSKYPGHSISPHAGESVWDDSNIGEILRIYSRYGLPRLKDISIAKAFIQDVYGVFNQCFYVPNNTTNDVASTFREKF